MTTLEIHLKALPTSRDEVILIDSLFLMPQNIYFETLKIVLPDRTLLLNRMDWDSLLISLDQQLTTEQINDLFDITFNGVGN